VTSGAERRDQEEHLAGCHSCRAGLEAEDAFDQTLRRQLRPAPLGRSFRARLETVLASQRSPAPSWTGAHAWHRAAAVLFVAGLLPLFLWSGPLSPDRSTTRSTLARAPQFLQGRLVCFQCARAGGLGAGATCRGRSAEHASGIMDDSGKVWRFLDGASTASTRLADPGERGRRVRLEGRIYSDTGYLQVSSSHYL
jgi:hypothetical protein